MKSVREKIANNDAFCVMPWVHLHITTNGDVNACCLVRAPFGNINKASIEEIWNGEEVNKLRSDMLKNVKDARCGNCYKVEESGGKSLRQNSNRRYWSHFLTIMAGDEKTEGSGAAPPIYWDIRFSNICNFRCRSCYHGASSRWFDEAEKLGETSSDKPIIRAVEDLDKFYMQIEDSIESVEEIYFAGGEPLIMEEHYKILSILERTKGFDKYLRYNTNFSRFHFNGRNIFNIWSQFKNVLVSASLDGWGERGEFLRKEQKWDEVLKNRELMKELCPHISFAVNVTVSAFNVIHIPDFHRKLVSLKFVNIEDFIIGNLLITPKYYSVKILPMDYKLKIKEKYEQHMEWIKSYVAENPDKMLRYNNITGQFKNCLNFLFAQDMSEEIPNFIARCNELDRFRNENTREVFPELAFLFDSSGR